MLATKAASGWRKPGVRASLSAVEGYVNHSSSAGWEPSLASLAATAAAADADGGVGGRSWKNSHVTAVMASEAAEMVSK